MSASLQSLMRQQLANEQPSPLLAELLSFLIIGGVAAASFVGVSAGAVALLRDMPSWMVSALCYSAYVVPVYLLHRKFSFHSSVSHRRALPRYAAVQIGGMMVATGFSYLAYGRLGLPAIPAALMVIGLTSGVNFVILRAWAFSRS